MRQRSAADQTLGGEREQRLLVIHDPEDIDAVPSFDNVRMALQYARLIFDEVPVSDVGPSRSFERFSCILFCCETLDLLSGATAARIRDYVANGGSIAVVYRGWSDDLCELFGIEYPGGWPDFSLADEEGLNFVSDLFPAFHDLQLTSDDIWGHAPLDIRPKPDCEVIATNARGRPLAWLNHWQDGRVVYWNTVALGEKRLRGLIIQSVACAQQTSVLPLANVGVVQVDDYPPCPLDRLPEPIATEFPGLKPREFYYRVWNKDMLELGKEFGITYSYFCIMNYEDIELLPEHLQSGGDLSDLAPHFDWTEAAEIADSGELGLHGFSHRPLLLEYWKSAADMQRTVAVCRRIWTDRHDAPLPTSFVPPNNEYDQCCTQALTEYFPEITAICSTYGHGQFSRGGDREFGPEPWAPGLFAIPRSTSGMEMIAENRLEMVSQLETMGVWTHFVHPDDSFDTPQSHPDETSWRNPLSRSWRATNQDGQAGLLHAFRDWLSFVKQHFPWLRFVSTCDAVSLLRSHLNLNFQVRYGENRILIASQPDIYFRLRSNAPSRINPAGISNAELIDIDEHDRFAVYTFRSTAAEVELDLI